MEYAIETLNIEMYSLNKDYRKLKSIFIIEPKEETETLMAEIVLQIENLQTAISTLHRNSI